jgi:transcriptional regulator with XRE-family HTH domain
MPAAQPDEDLDDLGRLVRGARKKLKLSQDVLAEKIGTSQSVISAIEQGRTAELAAPFVARLARELRVDPGAIVTACEARAVRQGSSSELSLEEATSP